MERLGIRFDEIPETIGWDSALVFARHVARDPRSATFRELNPELYEFCTPWKHSAILADIYDAITCFNYTFAKAYTPKGEVPPQKPKPYPRPGAHDDDTYHIGAGAIPIADFDAWYYGGDS